MQAGKNDMAPLATDGGIHERRVAEINIASLHKALYEMREWARVQQRRITILERKLEAMERRLKSVSMKT